MKNIGRICLLIVFMSLIGIKAYAYDIKVNNEDGVTIYYNYINGGWNLEVTYKESSTTSTIGVYSYTTGYETYNSFHIPEEVTYMDETRQVTSIGDYAFTNCNKLQTISIPNSITNIGSHAFSSCSKLNNINIPNSVTTIGASAFLDCSGLTVLTIGNSVKFISDSAFRNCPEIKDVYCHAENVPATAPNAFEGSYIEHAILHVPAESIGAYKATEPWKNFKEIVALTDSDPKPDATGINIVKNTKDNKAVIYNMNGVRQTEPQKGISILNGKKYVIK